MNAFVDLRATRVAAPLVVSPYPVTPSAIDRGGTPWDDHQRAWILDLRERGFPAEVVAAALGRSVETIYAQYQLVGSRIFVRRTWSAADAARAIARAEAGEPLKVVAADYGRSLDQLRGMFETRGYRPGRRADWRAEELASLRARLAAGDDCVTIGAALGRSAASVRQKAAALGLGRGAVPARGSRARRVGVAAAVGTGCRWDAAAEARLAALIAVEGPDALASVAAAIGSTPRMVRVKALALGLVPRKRARRGLTVEGEALVRRLAATTSVTAMARQVGCDIRTLKAWASAEGLVFAPAKRVVRPAPPVRAIAAEARPDTRPAAPASPAAPRAPAAGAVWRSQRLVAAAVPPPPAAEQAGAVEAARGPAARVRFVARVEPVEADRFRRYRRPSTKAGRPADAAALLRDTGDAIAAFLATRGVTRVRLEPRAELEAAVRRRGYALVASGAGYLVDGRVALDSLEALRDFAEARRIAA